MFPTSVVVRRIVNAKFACCSGSPDGSFGACGSDCRAATSLYGQVVSLTRTPSNNSEDRRSAGSDNSADAGNLYLLTRSDLDILLLFFLHIIYRHSQELRKG